MTITMVIDAATTVSMLTCWLILSQFRPVMKVSGRLTQKKTRMATKPINVP